MVTFPMVSPESQASLFLRRRVVLRSASIPNHRRMYLWGAKEFVQEGRHSWGGATSLLPISLGMETHLFTHLMIRFHFLSQGMPKIICLHPKFSVTISFLYHIFFLISIVQRPYFSFAPSHSVTDLYLLAFPDYSRPLLFPL